MLPQFKSQEPGTNREIEQFMTDYVDLSVGNVLAFAKLNVNPPPCDGYEDDCSAGSDLCCPSENGIYDFLRTENPGKVRWNWFKFLVSARGEVAPDRRLTNKEVDGPVTNAIESLLADRELMAEAQAERRR